MAKNSYLKPLLIAALVILFAGFLVFMMSVGSVSVTDLETGESYDFPSYQAEFGVSKGDTVTVTTQLSMHGIEATIERFDPTKDKITWRKNNADAKIYIWKGVITGL